MRFGAMAYEKNHPGKYPSNSDALWTDPPGPGDYTLGRMLSTPSMSVTAG